MPFGSPERFGCRGACGMQGPVIQARVVESLASACGSYLGGAHHVGGATGVDGAKHGRHPVAWRRGTEGKDEYDREVESKHGRVGMLAALGFVVGENFHPLLGGGTDLPSYLAFQQTWSVRP